MVATCVRNGKNQLAPFQGQTGPTPRIDSAVAVKFQDYYQTLGVPKTASQDEIQRAYRKLARKYHPDVNKEKGAEQKFKELSEAYEVLKDPDKRKQYDELGANWKAGQEFKPPPGWKNAKFDFGGPGGFSFGGDGFSDFFEMFFGRSAGPGRGGARVRFGPHGAGFDFEQEFQQAGATHEAQITISLEDAYHGAKRQITLSDNGGPPKTYDVKIPRGVTEGAKIRLAGQGGPGRGGAPPGDLILIVHLAQHPNFQVDGHDLTTTLPLTPWEAALGAKLPVDTLEGQVTLTIPPGAASGQKLRLRGKGLPHRGHPDRHGDLYVLLKIVVPKELSDEERRLFEELAKVSRFDPRHRP